MVRGCKGDGFVVDVTGVSLWKEEGEGFCAKKKK